VQRIWKAFSLQPHRSETFKLSTDPLFVETVRDIVGLYLNPPDRAVVLCVDEKSQVQALDRTQPILPLRPGGVGQGSAGDSRWNANGGQAERRTHDYKRHGTTSLFAALDVKAGTVIAKCMPRHRAGEFRRFLDMVEKNVPAGLDVEAAARLAGGRRLGPSAPRAAAPAARRGPHRLARRSSASATRPDGWSTSCWRRARRTTRVRQV
jgi:hypothetical protein